MSHTRSVRAGTKTQALVAPKGTDIPQAGVPKTQRALASPGGRAPTVDLGWGPRSCVSLSGPSCRRCRRSGDVASRAGRPARWPGGSRELSAGSKRALRPFHLHHCCCLGSPRACEKKQKGVGSGTIFISPGDLLPYLSRGESHPVWRSNRCFSSNCGHRGLGGFVSLTAASRGHFALANRFK